MTKVKIEIDIPKGHEVDTVRHTNSHYDGTLVYCVTVKAVTRFEICGQLSEWPEWLTCDWVAKDENGRVHAYNGRRPTKESKRWHSYDGWWDITDILPIRIPGPWEQSLRKNPKK